MARKKAKVSGRTRPGAGKAARKAARRSATAAKKRTVRKPARSRKTTTSRSARSPKKAAARKARKVPAKSKKIQPRTKPAASKPAAKPVRPAVRAAKAAKQEIPFPKRAAPSLERNRRRLTEVEDNIPTPPSSLDLDRTPTAARSGRQTILTARSHHNETGPELTGGDVDASWEDAYAVGDEAPGGDNPTPDQDRVDDIGRALGVEYQDNEELKGSDKIAGRDKHRWELDPASAEDYNSRDDEE
jgi:hypothetical protein